MEFKVKFIIEVVFVGIVIIGCFIIIVIILGNRDFCFYIYYKERKNNGKYIVEFFYNGCKDK